MNTPDSGTFPLEAAPPAVPVKDRYVGLVIFGILTMLLGGLILLFILMMLFGVAAAAKTSHETMPLATLLPGMSLYGFLAVALVWLGIGSIMARRWARALLLIFSWCWLVVGVLTTVAMAVILPKILSEQFAGAGMKDAQGHPVVVPLGAVVTGMLMFFGLVFVLLPAIWTSFYQSRYVKATCERRNPVVCWTDACPLPVLGFSLWLAFSVPMLILMPLIGHGVFPFFGCFLQGVPGSLAWLVVAGLWAYSAWSLYHLDARGWWLILMGFIGFSLSSVVTYGRHDLMEVYQLMGYPQTQIDQMQKLGFLTGHNMQWLMGLCLLPMGLYLLCIKRFMHSGRET